MNVDRFENLDKALYTLQKVDKLNIHLGGESALLYSFSLPFIVARPSRLDLFYEPDTIIPDWFKNYDWKKTLHYDCPEFKILYTENDFLPKDINVLDYPLTTPSIKVSGYERAVLEFLYGVPEHNFLELGAKIMELRDDLNPELLQVLLEHCPCTRTKRLFIYCAEKWEHDFLEKLDLRKIDLGDKEDKTYFDNPKKWGEVSFNKKFNMNLPLSVEEMGYAYEYKFFEQFMKNAEAGGY